MKNFSDTSKSKRFVITANLAIIVVVAILGIAIAYMMMAIFTKHGEETKIPKVENISYTKAVEILHSQGFNVDIRDSLFRDDYKPGYVIEQFPRANSLVKPGRKVFLYINAVHPKEVVIDDGASRTTLAMKNWSFRQAKSRLAELGFKNVRSVTVLGADDRVVKILANGRPVFQMQKVAVNAPVIIEVSDGRLGAMRDSLYEAERIHGPVYDNFGNYPGGNSYSAPASQYGGEVENNSSEPEYFEEPEYFVVDDESGGD